MSDDPEDRIEAGLDLLASASEDELTVKEAIDRLETISEAPSYNRQVLERAEMRGLIERDGTAIILQGSNRGIGTLESNIVTKDGHFECSKCGRSLSTGYFIDLEHREVGPFGSTCIRKVTGREDE